MAVEHEPFRLGPPGDEAGDEIRFHLEARARELEASGMTPGEARTAALRTFGDPGKIAAELRRIDGNGRWRTGMDALAQDLRYALRGLVRRPGLTAVVVLTLGLGIGAVTAVFGVVDAAFLRALPFPEAQRLVFLQGAFDAPEGPRVRGASAPEARDWGALSHAFTGVAAVDGISVDLQGEGGAERVPAELVDAGYFRLLEANPVVGRAFTPEEYRGAAPDAPVILGHGLWTRRFGADPGVIGRTVTVNGRPRTAVGVAPEGFRGATLRAEAWLPLAVLGENALESRGRRWLGVVARLKPGTSLEAARADMQNVTSRLEAEHPDTHRDRIALVRPFREAYLGEMRLLMVVILAASALLLAVAAVDVVSILLVRATARRDEVLVRRALGVGRARLMGQFLVEGLLLSAAGAATGLVLGTWGAGALADAMPPFLLPPFVDVRPGMPAFLLTAGLLTVVGVAAGLAPGLLAVRRDVAGGLRAASSRHPAGTGVQDALVVAEVALALTLLVGAGLMGRSFRAQLAVEPGYDAGALYGFSVDLPADRYPEAGLTDAAGELAQRLERHPAVAGVAWGSDVPLRGGSTASVLELESAAGEDVRARYYVHRVAPGWFDVLGTGILRGRPLDAGDSGEAADVAVISRAMAQRFFPGLDPVGRRLELMGTSVNVVGVAEDARWRDLTSDIREGADDPDVYLPWLALPSRSVAFVLRSRSGSPATLDSVVREVVADVDPDAPVYAAGPLADDLRDVTARARFGASLLTAFSALAAFLAAVGLYGVLAFTVGRRRREIAVRMAVGASAGDVRRLVLGRGLRLTAAGVGVGVGAAAVAARGLGAVLYGVEPLDGPTYAGVAALLGLVALVATWIPARRATRVEPRRALGEE